MNIIDAVDVVPHLFLAKAVVGCKNCLLLPYNLLHLLIVPVAVLGMLNGGHAEVLVLLHCALVGVLLALVLVGEGLCGLLNFLPSLFDLYLLHDNVVGSLLIEIHLLVDLLFPFKLFCPLNAKLGLGPLLPDLNRLDALAFFEGLLNSLISLLHLLPLDLRVPFHLIELGLRPGLLCGEFPGRFDLNLPGPLFSRYLLDPLALCASPFHGHFLGSRLVPLLDLLVQLGLVEQVLVLLGLDLLLLRLSLDPVSELLLLNGDALSFQEFGLELCHGGFALDDTVNLSLLPSLDGLHLEHLRGHHVGLLGSGSFSHHPDCCWVSLGCRLLNVNGLLLLPRRIPGFRTPVHFNLGLFVIG
mmetsp:Transcript_12887/g.26307  ORF Transcript_12887/g.26307 Transcript_12887/m.26307 type:complete len:356 (-) Transcript_12887:324-1391(-)